MSHVIRIMCVFITSIVVSGCGAWLWGTVTTKTVDSPNYHLDHTIKDPAIGPKVEVTHIKSDDAYEKCMDMHGRVGSWDPYCRAETTRGVPDSGSMTPAPHAPVPWVNYSPIGGYSPMVMDPYATGFYPPIRVATPGELAAAGIGNMVYPVPVYGPPLSATPPAAASGGWTAADAAAAVKTLVDHEHRIGGIEGKKTLRAKPAPAAKK